MIENNLLTVVLSFHETLSCLKNLRNEGKQICNRLCDLLTEKQILTKSPNRHTLSNRHESLYINAINEIGKKVGEQMALFETSYLQRLLLTQSSMLKAQQILDKIKLDATWVSTQNTDYKYGLYELKQIFRRLSKQERQQIQMIEAKWENIKDNLLRNKNPHEEIKLLAHHISFETHVEDGLLKSWDQIITGLQNKRHR